MPKRRAHRKPAPDWATCDTCGRHFRTGNEAERNAFLDHLAEHLPEADQVEFRVLRAMDI